MTEEQIEQLMDRCKARGADYQKGVADTHRDNARTIRELADSLDDKRNRKNGTIDLLQSIAGDFDNLSDALR